MAFRRHVMRSMRRLLVAVTLVVGGAAAFIAVWERNRRIGTALVNRVVNPRLTRAGAVGGRRSELGTIEHLGRVTGARRLTPVHPEPIPGGFRILVPLGEASEWARNVIAAGGCRLQLHEAVYELGDPVLVEPRTIVGVPAVARLLFNQLGFRYLLLRTKTSGPGLLVDATDAAATGLIAAA
jgi:hypothetical protein